MTYELKPLSNEELPELRRFISSNFSKGNQELEPNWLSWILDNPNNVYIQLCKYHQEIVAMSIFLPILLTHKNNTYSGAFSISTMVAPQHRRKGLGSRIHESRLKLFDFALSSGQSYANRQLYTKKGFHVLGRDLHFMAIKKFPKFIFKKNYLRYLYSWIRWLSFNVFWRPTCHIELSDSIPNNIPPSFLSSRLPTNSVVSPRHSIEYLKWRYEQHPYLHYKFCSVFKNQHLIAVIVFREESEKASLIDLYCNSDDTPLALHNFLTLTDYSQIHGRVVGSTLKSILNQAGAYVWQGHNMYMGNSKNNNLTSLLVEHDWCLFMGDSDRDSR